MIHSFQMATLSCDYLVVGGGAMGLAFVDELIHGSKELTVVMVDRRSKPGFTSTRTPLRAWSKEGDCRESGI